MFPVYELGDEKAPVCEISCFYHNLNTILWNAVTSLSEYKVI